MSRLQTWLINSGAAAWLLLLMSALATLMMALDRDPPFRSISYTAQSARPGGVAMIDAVVQRDLARSCSVRFSRFFIDSTGARWEVAALTSVTANGLRAFDAASANRLRLPVPIPAGAAPGPATLVIPLAYRCNMVHELSPIDVVLTYDFEVLP